MFTWILIAFVIAVIFGVIKIDELKPLAEKWLPKLKQLFNQAKTQVENKVSELKSNENKTETTETDKTDSAE